MDFTYDGYIGLIDLLKSKGYIFSNYLNCHEFDKTIIMRHDVDMSLTKALEFAKLEYDNNIKSTYFVLLSTNFYNIFSKESRDILNEIRALGHDIGLHFDEKKYNISNFKELESWITREKDILEQELEYEIKTVSMHRPSKWILENDIQFDNIINSYSKEFIFNFKYLSDSRMHWREDVLNIIENENYDRLHILTHPFWYSDKEETLNKKIIRFINGAKMETYDYLKDNIRDIDEIISEGEILNDYTNKKNY